MIFFHSSSLGEGGTETLGAEDLTSGGEGAGDKDDAGDLTLDEEDLGTGDLTLDREVFWDEGTTGDEGTADGGTLVDIGTVGGGEGDEDGTGTEAEDEGRD